MNAADEYATSVFRKDSLLIFLDGVVSKDAGREAPSFSVQTNMLSLLRRTEQHSRHSLDA